MVKDQNAGIWDRPLVRTQPEKLRGYNIVVMCQLAKLIRRVRFPLPAPFISVKLSSESAKRPVEAESLERNQEQSLYAVLS